MLEHVRSRGLRWTISDRRRGDDTGSPGYEQIDIRMRVKADYSDEDLDERSCQLC